MSSFTQRILPRPKAMCIISQHNNFYGDELLARRPNPKLEDHSLSEVRDRYSPSISGGRLLHSQPEDALWNGEKEPT
jgi:hypothetical protein